MPVADLDILRVVWTAKINALRTKVQNIYYYQVQDIISADNEDIQADFVADAVFLYNKINTWLSSDYVAESLRTTNATKKELVGDSVPVFAGLGAAGASTPAQVAVEILGRARKTGHVGRKYIGPVIEATHDDGVLVAGALVDFSTFAISYVQDITGTVTGNTYRPALVKFAAGGGVASFILLDRDLSFVVETARTQRRRTPGVGFT